MNDSLERIANNKMEQVAKMFGVRLNEKFKISEHENLYVFTPEGLFNYNSYTEGLIMNRTTLLYELLAGYYTVEKFIPNYNWPRPSEMYYTPSIDDGEPKYTAHRWEEDKKDLARLDANIAFRTKDEALEVAQKMLDKVQPGK